MNTVIALLIWLAVAGFLAWLWSLRGPSDYDGWGQP
jgi:hypothetical protein